MDTGPGATKGNGFVTGPRRTPEPISSERTGTGHASGDWMSASRRPQPVLHTGTAKLDTDRHARVRGWTGTPSIAARRGGSQAMIPAVAPAGDGLPTGQPPGRVPLVGQLVHVQSHHWLVTQVTPLHYPEVGRASPLPVPMMATWASRSGSCETTCLTGIPCIRMSAPISYPDGHIGKPLQIDTQFLPRGDAQLFAGPFWRVYRIRMRQSIGDLCKLASHEDTCTSQEFRHASGFYA